MDWKDALGALKDSGAIPIDESADNITETEDNQKNDSIQKETLRVGIDRKGRKGKTATIVEGWTGSDDDLDSLAQSLKKRLGTGGSARGGEILIQGDRKEDVMRILKDLGYKVKPC